MRRERVRPSLLLFGLLLAGCEQPRPAAPWPWWQGPEPYVAPPPAPPGPTRATHETSLLPPQYRGVIGTDSVTLTLDGNYYGHRRGRELVLSGPAGDSKAWARTDSLHPLRLTVFDWNADAPINTPDGQFELAGRPGRLLVGEWCLPGGRPRPVRLRPSYWGAARLRPETWSVSGRMVELGGPFYEGTDSASFWADYYTLPAGHPAAAVVNKLLGPPRAPAAMPRYLDSLLRQADYNRGSTSYWLWVEYNDDFLLSVSRHTDVNCIECETQVLVDGVTVDLRTGRQLRLADLLRPGAEARLLRLLARRMAEETDWDAESFASLPAGGFRVVPAGLRFTYDRRDVPDLCCTGSDQPNHILGTTLSFAELRPLLRPDSPLTRVLRQRGLVGAKPARRLRR